MTWAGETVLSFDRDTAKQYLIDLAYFQIASRVSWLNGPLGFIGAFFSKIVLGWFFEYSAEGIHRVEVFISSRMKEKKYIEVRKEIEKVALEKGESISEKEKKQLFDKYYAAARNALTL